MLGGSKYFPFLFDYCCGLGMTLGVGRGRLRLRFGCMGVAWDGDERVAKKSGGGKQETNGRSWWDLQEECALQRKMPTLREGVGIGQSQKDRRARRTRLHIQKKRAEKTTKANLTINHRVEISGNAKALSSMSNSSHHVDYDTREKRRKASMFLNDPELLITHAEASGMVRPVPRPPPISISIPSFYLSLSLDIWCI